MTLRAYVQAARVIAQLLVAGGTILFRAGAQAYKQAIVSAFHVMILNTHCCGIRY